MMQKYKKIICIITHKGSQDRLQAIKETWLSRPLPRDYLVLFVYGNDGGVVPRLEGQSLYLEATDSWANLPNKIYCMFNFLVANYQFDYLYKIDDDNFVQRSSIISYPKTRTDYAGIFQGNTCFHETKLSSSLVTDSFADQHNIPHGYRYEGHVPWRFACGSLYLLSYRIVRFIVSRPPQDYEDCNMKVGAEDIMVGKAVIDFSESIKPSSVIIDDWNKQGVWKYFKRPSYFTNLTAKQIYFVAQWFWIFIVKTIFKNGLNKVVKNIGARWG